MEAAASAQAALAVVEGTGESRIRVCILDLLSVIESDKDQDDDAEAHARAVEQERAYALPVMSIRSGRGYVCMQRDEWQQADEYFDHMRKLLAGTESVDVRFVIGSLAAEVAVQLGRANQALEMVADTLRLAREVGARHQEGVARRVQAQALASLRRMGRGDRRFQ